LLIGTTTVGINWLLITSCRFTFPISAAAFAAAFTAAFAAAFTAFAAFAATFARSN